MMALSKPYKITTAAVMTTIALASVITFANSDESPPATVSAASAPAGSVPDFPGFDPDSAGLEGADFEGAVSDLAPDTASDSADDKTSNPSSSAAGAAPRSTSPSAGAIGRSGSASTPAPAPSGPAPSGPAPSKPSPTQSAPTSSPTPSNPLRDLIDSLLR